MKQETMLRKMRAIGTMQNQIIQASRALLQPTPVKHGRKPQWLHKKLKELYKEGVISQPDSVDAACEAIDSQGWCDHWGTTTIRGRSNIFVSEPYHLEKEGAEAFADLVDAEHWWCPNSWHYPGKTFRVLFIPKK